jgi:hypothetical protein
MARAATGRWAPTHAACQKHGSAAQLAMVALALPRPMQGYHERQKRPKEPPARRLWKKKGQRP